MKVLAQTCFRTIGGTARSGLRLGFLLALLYSAAFALYAVGRSSWQIAMTLPPDDSLLGTLVANAFALLLPILVFAFVLGVGAALLQCVTLLLVYGVAAVINPHRRAVGMAGIGLISATLLAAAIQLAVHQSLGSYFDALWPSGYLFWLGLPSLLFVGATTWVSWQQGNDAVAMRTQPVGAAA